MKTTGYQYDIKDCPICKGSTLPVLKFGHVTCNLCGNRSPEPCGGYRFICIDTDNGNKRIVE